jgi:ATP-binding cassette, subfamily A (ABC1), member 3
VIDDDFRFVPPKCRNITSGAQSTFMNYLGSSGAVNYPVEAASVTDIEGMSRYILEHRKDRAASQIGAFSFYDIGYSAKTTTSVNSASYVIHGNFSALHSGPLYASILADTVVKSISPTASVKVNLNPLPITYHQKTLLSNYNVNLVVTFILLAVPYVPAAFATFIVREREVKAKHQQLVSGVSVPAYWLAAFLWDNFSYQLTVWLIVILVAVFPNTQSLSGRDTIGATIGLLILFGGAVSGFTYMISFAFSTPSGAQIAMIFIVFILGLILTIVGFVLRSIPTTNKAYVNVIRYIFALFPPFAFGDGLQNLTLIEALSFLELEGGKVYSPLDWNITGMNLTFLAWETVVYLLAVILYEYFSEMPSLQTRMSTSALPPDDESTKDEDVIAEEVKVASGAADDCSILVKGIKKVYPGGKYAVRGLSLAIPTGECFGLLGINGAGKSTALNMLSGEFRPTVGSASLAGLDLLNDVHKCRRKIGFCPQFDALFELLTGREHLQLYARIKGINEEDVNRVADGKIAEMGLTEYADRAAGTYSGGNKRKLSVAIAMVGEPSIVFLDEPSTGMDPVARRFMWEIISDIVTKREKCSLILTTHSMEECEALCTRIGIMVGGVLRCLGSSQRLRTRYGHGFQIEIGMVIPSADDIAVKVRHTPFSRYNTVDSNLSDAFIE